MILLGNGRLITQNPELPYLANGCVAVADGGIVDFGPTAELQARYAGAELYDAAGRLLMPGLINAHTHIYSSFARGLSLPQEKPNRDFIDILNNLWWRIDKVLNTEDNRYSAYATGLESVRCGVTTIFDHHASQRHVEGSLFAISEALAEIGLRASLCYEVSDRDGTAVAEQGITENIAFIDQAARDESGMISGMFGLHASFTLSDRTLEKCLAALGSRAAGFHIHVAEGRADLEDSLKKYGKRVVERLQEAGVLGARTLAVHDIHINEAELAILKETDTPCVHNPESNMGNAVGCANVLAMCAKGLLVGLGTDAYTQDMFESLKAANLIHKHQSGNPSVGFGESLQMLFGGNAQIAHRHFGRPLGIIAKGAAADLIVVDYTPHTPLDENTLGGHIMFGLMGRAVDSTMINGRFAMKERVMQTVDEQAVLAKAREQAAGFWRRVAR